MKSKIIRIYWSKPLTIEDTIKSLNPEKVGLYYITCLVRGREKSLYIGKSSTSIRRRLISHNDGWVHRYRGKIYVRIGEIIYPRRPDADVIDQAESALIYEHRNILLDNTDKRNTYSYYELYSIENTGNIFELNPAFKMRE